MVHNVIILSFLSALESMRSDWERSPPLTLSGSCCLTLTIEGGLGWVLQLTAPCVKNKKRKLLKEQDNSTSPSILYKNYKSISSFRFLAECVASLWHCNPLEKSWHRFRLNKVRAFPSIMSNGSWSGLVERVGPRCGRNWCLEELEKTNYSIEIYGT